MFKYTLIVCLIISQLASAACARKKPAGQDCGSQIKKVEATLQDRGNSLEKAHKSTITNLITAAKIHQQHNEEMLCLEKTHRALTLLQENTPEENKKN